MCKLRRGGARLPLPYMPTCRHRNDFTNKRKALDRNMGLKLFFGHHSVVFVKPVTGFTLQNIQQLEYCIFIY